MWANQKLFCLSRSSTGNCPCNVTLWYWTVNTTEEKWKQSICLIKHRKLHSYIWGKNILVDQLQNWCAFTEPENKLLFKMILSLCRERSPFSVSSVKSFTVLWLLSTSKRIQWYFLVAGCVPKLPEYQNPLIRMFLMFNDLVQKCLSC